ncbi:MAG: aminopeptidase family protein P, partial [Pseudomonadota bacterium]
RSTREKVSDIQETLKSDGDIATVVTQPDSLCWLLNIRGADVEHNPVVLAFAILPADGPVDVFLASERVPDAAMKALDGVARFRPANAFEAALRDLKSEAATSGQAKVRVAPATTAYRIGQRLGAKTLRHAPDPCVLPRAIKTPAEIAGARAAHHRDGVAVCRFLAWLDREIEAGTKLTEIATAEKLEAFRAETGKLREISFDTISGSGPNGAIVHYRVTEATDRTFRRGELYLVDSGAQYPDGTTDITRTVAVGRPPKSARLHTTLVLKGHIAIATARFPKGTRGVDLDPFARRALWDHGLDYAHGTGHGVGSYLSVHEGPQGISRRTMTVLEAGMIVSNEPGYYKTDAYGIRLENLVLVEEAETPKDGDIAMHTFETLTLAPFDRRLIDVGQLTDTELAWLNAYHARVFKEIGPELESGDRAWLKAACAKL